MTTSLTRPSSSTTAPGSTGPRRSGPGRHLRLLVSGVDVRQFGMLFALIGLTLLFQVLTGGNVLTPGNMINLLNGNSYILVLAIGMVLVIIAGHIDLSVGSVAAFAGIVVALAMRDLSLPWWAGVLIGLAVGALIGAWQGFWVAVVGIPAFITTLAGMLLFRGANQYVGQSNTVPVDAAFQYLGAGYLPQLGPDFGYSNPTLLLGLATIALVVVMEFRTRANQRRIHAEVKPVWVSVLKLVVLGSLLWYVTYLFATGRVGTSFPVPGLILAALIIIYSFVASRTVFGRHVYAVGGNIQAARLSGVSSRKVNFLVMMNMSVLAALAGMMFVGRSTASGPFDGTQWELDAIAAVFIGGAAVSGGVGTVIGSIIGGLVMAVLNNGLQLMGVGSDLSQIIKGLVLLVAVAFDVYNKTQGRPSLIGLMTRGRGTGSRAAVPSANPSTGTPEEGSSITEKPRDPS